MWNKAIILMLLVSCLAARAMVITAASAAETDVMTAITSAVSGDEVDIPAGTATWTTLLGITNKSITISGAGTNLTVITDGMVDRTFTMIAVFHTNLTGLFRITGIQFKDNGTNTPPNELPYGFILYHGTDNINARNAAVRFDHLYFNRLNQHAFFISSHYGVIDNCWFEWGTLGVSMVDFQGWFNNGDGDGGDRSWSLPVQWGTTNAGVYIEHCVFSHTNAFPEPATDGYGGARYVVRYNTMTNCNIQNHGTESGGRIRGGRSIEAYGNYATNTVGNVGLVYLRSGTATVCSNTLGGTWTGCVQGVNYRNTDIFRPWGQANGTNAWDLNSATLYDSGTHTGANNVQFLTDNTKTWTVNQWTNYHVIDTSSGIGAPIYSNSASSIYYYTNLGQAPIFSQSLLYFTNGNTYQIRKLLRGLDQPGVGVGALLNGGDENTPPSQVGWTNQLDEPIYYWSNSQANNLVNNGSLYPTIVDGVQATNAVRAGFAPLQDPHPLVPGGGGGGCVGPSISGNPSSATVTVGDNNTFSVTASGDATLAYQWKKNGTNISSATSSSYALSNVQLTNAGSYLVIVTNTCGTATSSAAVLTVNSASVGKRSRARH